MKKMNKVNSFYDQYSTNLTKQSILQSCQNDSTDEESKSSHSPTNWPSIASNYAHSSNTNQFNYYGNYYANNKSVFHQNQPSNFDSQLISSINSINSFQNQTINHPTVQLTMNDNRNSVGSSSNSSSHSSPSPPLRNDNSNDNITKLIPSSILKLSSDSSSMPLKKRRPVPSENKDPLYWEKRRKNNESAKRSREMRRTKEEHVTLRAFYLEQENTQLKSQLSVLREEMEKLRAILYNNQNLTH
jgi:hypothetical protein